MTVRAARATARTRAVVGGPAASVRGAAAPFAGETHEMTGHGLFVVDDLSVWFVESGAVDLLSMSVVEGVPRGERHRLFSVTAGQIFLGLAGAAPPLGHALVAAASPGARLMRAPRAALADAFVSARHATRARALVDAWIETLHRAWEPTDAPPGGAVIERGREMRFEGPTPIRVPGGVQWIQTQGVGWLRGNAALPVEGDVCFPLAADTWVEMQPGSQVFASQTADLPTFAVTVEGLARLSALVWAHRVSAVESRKRALAERVRNVQQSNQNRIEAACATLAAVNLPARHAALAAQGGRSKGKVDRSSALLHACRLVAQELGVGLEELPASEVGAGQDDAVHSLLRASRLRARKVALRDGWWRQDQGPLLGFMEPDNEPVALVRQGARYVVAAGAEAPILVDADVARRLAPFGMSFYVRLPDAKLRIWDLLRFSARGSKGDLLFVVVMALLATLLGMVPPVATGVLFNSIIPGAHRSQLTQLTLILVVCALSSAIFGLVRGYGLLRVQQRMSTALQAAVWDRLIRLPVAFFRPYSAGELSSRVMAIEGIQSALSGTVLTTILSGFFSLANFAMMFAYSPAMAVRAMILVVVAIAVTVVSGALDLRPQSALIRLQAQISGFVLQLLSNVSKLRVAGAETRAFGQWADLFARQRRLRMNVRRISNWFNAFGAAFPILAEIFLFWLALPWLGKGSEPLRTGDFLAFGGAFNSCFTALIGTAAALMGALEVIPQYEQAKPILEACPEEQIERSNPGQLRGAIEIEKVSFRYHAEAPPVLKDVSLKIQPGEFVALVGPSGSGKSTLLRLLLGFEKPDGGAILYDGQELGGLDVQAVRRQMGVVLQNSSLISGDLHSNIATAHGCTLAEAWSAAEAAGIADDIRSMPMQMNTVVSEGGSTLSGGQKQRLMIARAIVNHPAILLFDEATSALDNRAQAQVCASLDRMQATRVVVAHRLSTIVNADRIVVLQDGRIVQSGTYKQLLAEGGLFGELARRQVL